MGDARGFLKHDRQLPDRRSVPVRLRDWREVYEPFTDDSLRQQASRCMDCGIPFCNDGCPLGNLIPDWNDLVHQGHWRDAIERLHATNNFPEFTGRLCPAPCEGSCVLGINEPPVTIKQVEVSIVDRAWAEGWITPVVPAENTGRRVAVVGSGPSGLACADQLNRAGHQVTVFERHDRVGGLLMYGIPNMKLEKQVVDRRVALLREEGIVFETRTQVGPQEPFADGHIGQIMEADGELLRYQDPEKLLESHDALLLATGATMPRDLSVPGRGLSGIHLAMDFLTRNTKSLLDSNLQDGKFISAANKHVVVIGGGDTGADCIGTALRHRCKSLVNFELLNCPPEKRSLSNPWPQWPLIFRVDYSHAEFAHRFGKDPRVYALLTKKLIGDGNGCVSGIQTIELDWSVPGPDTPFSEIPGTEKVWPCDLVLLSMGFVGPEKSVSNLLRVGHDERGNYDAPYGQFLTARHGVFAAGDCRRGQSLVVWAINEGRNAASAVDRYLSGAQGDVV